MRRFRWFVLIGLVAVHCFLLAHSFLEIKVLKKKLKYLRREVISGLHITRDSLLAELEDIDAPKQLPLPIKYVPFADDQGIILDVKNIEIPGIEAPYNASLLNTEEGYLLFFRYDTPVFEDFTTYHSHIGCAKLDSNFSVIDHFIPIHTGKLQLEDPRAIRIDGKYYLVFSERIPGKKYLTKVGLAQVDLNTGLMHSITQFDSRRLDLEKNWMPFTNSAGLHFVYTVNPHEILACPDVKKSDLIELVQFPEQTQLSSKDWLKKWGDPHGGTPALLVDGQYLAFFHSSFIDGKKRWYVMGAYTFEASYPYRITGISQYPIMFHGIYGTEYRNVQSNQRLKCIFPCGFVLENRNGRDVIQLSCGENDSATKILTLDKNALLKSLKPVNTP